MNNSFERPQSASKTFCNIYINIITMIHVTLNYYTIAKRYILLHDKDVM